MCIYSNKHNSQKHSLKVSHLVHECCKAVEQDSACNTGIPYACRFTSLAVLLWVQLPATVVREVVEDDPHFWRSRRSSWLQTLEQPSSGLCSYLGNNQWMEDLSVFFYFCCIFVFQIKIYPKNFLIYLISDYSHSILPLNFAFIKTSKSSPLSFSLYLLSMFLHPIEIQKRKIMLNKLKSSCKFLIIKNWKLLVTANFQNRKKICRLLSMKPSWHNLRVL